MTGIAVDFAAKTLLYTTKEVSLAGDTVSLDRIFVVSSSFIALCTNATVHDAGIMILRTVSSLRHLDRRKRHKC